MADLQPVTSQGLRSHPWRISYKTSRTRIGERPVNMLHDFYIPALRLVTRYDRVAGYFRSSSLAAASQGFSSFVNRGGKMRLIVGADLKPWDVSAILAGDEQLLATRLNGELEHPESWPEAEQDGVKLLAFMVANEYLDVKVAFRVHGTTGEPIPWDSVEDGYVHEKWFIMLDEFGNRLYGSGTMNESKTGLVLNAENIDVSCDWRGGIDQERVEEAEVDFADLWAGNVPHVPVRTLPQAVREKLIARFGQTPSTELREIDGHPAQPVLQPTEPPSPTALERLRFAVLRDGPKMPGGRFVGMETAPVEPWPHQQVVARRLIEGWPYSFLLCDEVGLGKTIEAGLAFRSLYLSGLAKRILIAAPASLTQQWQRQMASKMLLPFGRVYTGPQTGHEYLFPHTEKTETPDLFAPDLVILSTGLLARRDRALALRGATPYDVALVDEAHYARRRNSTRGAEVHPDYGQLFQMIRDSLRKVARSLWLATATPMQIDPVEVSDLLLLTGRIGAFQYDPSLMQRYYDLLAKLLRQEPVSNLEWNFLRRAVNAVKTQDPLYWRVVQENVIDGRMRLAAQNWLDKGRTPPGRDRDLIRRLIFMASPLARVMQRHTRALLEVYRQRGELKQNLATRTILPLPQILFSAQERQAYEALEVYCDGLTEQVSKQSDSKTRNMTSFLLSFLRLRFASSLYAIRETLRRRLRKVEATLRHQAAADDQGMLEEVTSFEDWVFHGEDEDDLLAVDTLLKGRSQPDLEWERTRLREMLEGLADLTGPSSKMQTFLQVLDKRRDPATRRIQQTVVFTRFFDTLLDIVERLRRADPDIRVGIYSGKRASFYDPTSRAMCEVDHEEVKARYLRGEVDVLVCTDAAAEGLNLQTADLLINFDLGWNPMKIEQRIGRIDRIGQAHNEIYVLNLCYADSAEEIVYGRLLARLAKANLVVGAQQVSLLPVGPDEFRALAEGKLTPEELEAQARLQLEEQRRRTAGMEINPQDLYEVYARLTRKWNQERMPVTLEAIWESLTESDYLKTLGFVVAQSTSAPMLAVRGISDTTEAVLLTVSRDLHERGLGAGRPRVHFASYGEPAFEAVLNHMAQFDLPTCVRRLVVPVPGLPGVEQVAYAAACKATAGPAYEVRCITNWNDLRSLELAEDVVLKDAEVEPLLHRLEESARVELGSYTVAERIEQANTAAAKAQELLNYLVSQWLLEARSKALGQGCLYRTTLDEVKALVESREYISLVDLPANLLRPIAGDLLFECSVPEVGIYARIEVPPILARSALDATRRLVDRLVDRRGELQADQVIKWLAREVGSIS